MMQAMCWPGSLLRMRPASSTRWPWPPTWILCSARTFRYSRAVGSTRLLVTCSTQGGHSWHDRGAASAVHALARAAATVAEQVPLQVPGCSANVGMFSGGTGINVIAAHAELQLDLRAISASI